MMKRRTFINATTILGACFSTGISASAQIIQPTLPSFISLHIQDLKGQILQTSSELNINNRYALAEEMLSIHRVVKEEYKGENYVFAFKNRSGNLIEFSKQNGMAKVMVS
ncbi:MAG: hypothetical protein R3E32_09525 [Chitinophagales bacterium]